MTQNVTIRRLGATTALLTLLAGPGRAQFDLGGEPGIDTLRNARNALIDAADFDAALDPATRIVESMAAADDPLLGQDMLLLARIQAGLNDFDTAAETYLDAIDVIKDADGVNSTALQGAYQGLGRNYLNDRRFDEALVAFEEARTISRRSDGLFNVDQAIIIDDMTLAHLGKGETTEARELQTERLDNAVRRFGADDERVIPFHTHLGDYLDNSRLRIGAREQYSRALEISEVTHGENAVESLLLLLRLEEIDLLLGQDNGIPLRIEAVLESASDLGPLDRARSLLLLGDRLLVDAGLEAALPRYRQAYRLLDGLAQLDANAVLSDPQPLNFVPPLSPVDRATRRGQWTWGELTLAFDVSAEGRASNVAVVDMSPEIERVAADYSRRIREAHFRPRFVNGDPVGTAAVRYRHNFRYYVRD